MLLPSLNRDHLTVRDLEQLHDHLAADPSFARHAISAMRQLDEEHVWRALWLLRRYGRGQELDAHSLSLIAHEADSLGHWVSRLILCQIFAEHPCPPDAREALLPFLRDCTAHRTPFVRAWAYSALHHFAADPRYRPETNRLLRAARTDKSKSVQARLRQLTKDSRHPR